MFFFCLTIIFKLPKCISDSCVCVFSDFTVMSVEETAKIVIKTDLIQFNVDKTTKQNILGCYFVHCINIIQMDIFCPNF